MKSLKQILKASASFISSPLNYICNKSILSGISPTRLKYSKSEASVSRPWKCVGGLWVELLRKKNIYIF